MFFNRHYTCHKSRRKPDNYRGKRSDYAARSSKELRGEKLIGNCTTILISSTPLFPLEKVTAAMWGRGIER